MTASIGSPVTAQASPDKVAAAQKKLDEIQAKSSAIDAKYTQLQQQLDAANRSLSQADSQLARGMARVAQLRKGLGQIALINFQTAGVGTTTQLVTSPDDTSFLNNLAVVQSVTNRSNGQLQELQASQAELTALEAQAKQSRDTIAAVTATQKNLVEQANHEESAAKAVLAKLNADEKKRLARLQQQQEQAALAAAHVNTVAAPAPAAAPAATTTRSANRPAVRAQAVAVPASGRASAAIAFAMAQIGKAYVYGATGPSAYDCSGLMMRAWAAAGVSIPRTSQAQYSAGTHVSLSQLQPGDLVFYYSGLTHVGMYIGGGKIVNAENPSVGIIVAPLTSMPVVGATRVG
ncbi:MAG TPA: NlpC/P60 family protein [Propionibacteriaceae bacterium]|nr:NlpC/P60 family protein [Propionibacteriaceae bacterium]